jgi:hypothetical protein
MPSDTSFAANLIVMAAVAAHVGYSSPSQIIAATG